MQETWGLIPRLGKSGEGTGNLLQYSCLENPLHRGAWWFTIHGHNWVTNTYIYTPHLIHSSITEHLGCFYTLAIVSIKRTVSLKHQNKTGLPWWSSRYDSVLPLQGAQVPSLVGEEYCILRGVAKNNKTISHASCFKKASPGTSLVVQWLGLHPSNAGDLDWLPG